MVAVYDHDHSPNKDSEISHFVRNAIMVAVLCIPEVYIFEAVRFFEAITAAHLCLSPLRSASALDTCAYVIGLKKKWLHQIKL